MYKKLLVKAGIFVITALMFFGTGSTTKANGVGSGYASTYSMVVSDINISFSISSYGAAKVSANVLLYAGGKGKNVNASIQKYDASTRNWKNYYSCNVPFQTDYDKNYPISSHGTYRCRLIVTATKNGQEERIVRTSGSVVY